MSLLSPEEWEIVALSLRVSAVAVAGWQLLRQLRAVEGGGAPGRAAAKRASVRFFLDRIVPEANGLKAAATAGADALYALDAEQLAR